MPVVSSDEIAEVFRGTDSVATGLKKAFSNFDLKIYPSIINQLKSLIRSLPTRPCVQSSAR